jgi:DNA-directed RNA polymerase alpha subunit
MSSHFDTSIEDLDLSVRCYNILRHHLKINILGDLTKLTEKEVMQHRHMGFKSLEEIRTLMSEAGLSFKEIPPVDKIGQLISSGYITIDELRDYLNRNTSIL